MKKRVLAICFSIVFIFLLILPASAAITYNRRIEIENGAESITMRAGQKRRLKVNTFWFKVPTSKDLRFYSSNEFIATVDRSGVVHANSQGKAYISVVNSNGDTSSILLIVEKGSKLSPVLLAVVIIPALGIYILMCNKKFRR